MSEKFLDILSKKYPEPKKLFYKYNEQLNSKDTLYVLDTNTLLIPYNVTKTSLDEIRKVYTKFIEEKRLFIPEHVAREFVENRSTKLIELYHKLSQKKSFPNLIEKVPLLESLPDYQDALENGKELKAAQDKYTKSINKVLDAIENWHWDDPVSKLYSDIFNDDSVFIEATCNQENGFEDYEFCTKHKIPPGYKDSNKDENCIGDFIIWKSILKLGKERKKNISFISGDEKADWWHRVNNKALYPRFELVEEFRQASDGALFDIISLSDFLESVGAQQEAITEIKDKEFYSIINFTTNLHYNIDEYKQNIIPEQNIIHDKNYNQIAQNFYLNYFKDAVQVDDDNSLNYFSNILPKLKEKLEAIYGFSSENTDTILFVIKLIFDKFVPTPQLKKTDSIYSPQKITSEFSYLISSDLLYVVEELLADISPKWLKL